MGNREYIAKWLDGTLSDEEKLMFERTEEYKSLARLSKALAEFKAPDFEVQAEFGRLQTKKMSLPKAKVITMPWLKPLLRIAAVLLVMAGSYFIYLSNSSTTINTQAAEKTKLFLPDSSAVMLNAFSKLSYRKRNWEHNRAVALEGEAFFTVAKGSRFDVETASGAIIVLGTQFNVKVRSNYFEVVCYEGSVQVESPLKVTILKPGERFRVVKGILAPDEQTHEILPGWLAQESIFESVPVAEVLEEFERQYNVTITTKNVNLDQLFTGRFAHGNISLALKSISIPLALTYEIDDTTKTVVLSGEAQ